MGKEVPCGAGSWPDVQENVTRVFDMMGGAAKMIEPNSTVVLKPNRGTRAPRSSPCAPTGSKLRAASLR